MIPAPNPMLLEDAVDLAALAEWSRQMVPACVWVDEWREALERARMERNMP